MAAAGPSAGVLGDQRGIIDRDLYENHPDWARQLVTIGRYPRTGHDRERWKTVTWDDYRARVGICGTAGPWTVMPLESKDDDVTAWVVEAEQLPPSAPGWYTSLQHRDRGLVMSDVPAEIAGALPFLDVAETIPGARILIAGLGLGIVPARLLRFGDVDRIDVVEIDQDVIHLITSGADQDAPNDWAADTRLHVWHGDALAWEPPVDGKCALHETWSCLPPDETWCFPPPGWDAAWFDIWDVVSPHNLPSMEQLHLRYEGRVARARMWSWERPECEAMLQRGQVLSRGCITLGGLQRTCHISFGDDEPDAPASSVPDEDAGPDGTTEPTPPVPACPATGDSSTPPAVPVAAGLFSPPPREDRPALDTAGAERSSAPAPAACGHQGGT